MKVILITALSLFFAANVFGQALYNQEFQVNTYTDFDQINPSVAKLSNGGFVICWESDGQDGSEEGIYAQKYDENGIKYGNEFQANTYTNDSQKNPSIAGLSDGGFIICWNSWGQDGSDYGIFAQIYDENGIRLGNEFQVNTFTNYSQVSPSVSKLSTGGFIICWASSVQDGSGRGIYAQMYDENGIKAGNEFQVNSYTSNSQDRPSLSLLSTGGFIVCWESWGQDGSYGGIFAQMYDENGAKVGNEFQVNTYMNSYQSNPCVTELSTGGFIICWDSYGQDGSSDGIFAQMYDENGAKVGNEFQVNTFTIGGQEGPKATELSNRGFVICWQSYGQDGSLAGIFAQMYDENGIKIGKEFWVSTFTNYLATRPSIVELSNARFIVCWESFKQVGGNSEVFGKYYLNEPLSHSLLTFELLEPQLDVIIINDNPIFKWNQASNIHINFPWELTYDLYLDNNSNFSHPTLNTGIQDTAYQVENLTPGQTYFWKVLARNFSGDSLWSSDVFSFYIDQNATDIKEIETQLPQEFELFQNYPNPFNPTTKIKFSIPNAVIASEATQSHEITSVNSFPRNDNINVSLKIYDILGNEIAILVNEQKLPGTYEVEFDGEGLTSGIYFYKLSVGKYSETRKMLLMK